MKKSSFLKPHESVAFLILKFVYFNMCSFINFHVLRGCVNVPSLVITANCFFLTADTTYFA